MIFNGKEVFTQETFRYDKAKIGDYVEESIVDNAINSMPPACMLSYCTQMGEPYSHRFDPDKGKWRSTYGTFKQIEGKIWQWCGYCFYGENVERGEEPIYC